MLFDVNNQLGCQKFDREAREDPLVGESPFIMVQMGTCSLFDKISNIEKAGGHLAVIISDKEEDVKGIFISEEGLGTDINIPAVLISNKDGKILANYYINHAHSHEEIKDIRIEVQFQNENLNNIVRYDIWYSPDQENAYLFLKEFKDLQKALDTYAFLGIHFFTYPHFSYDPEKKEKIKDCFGSGLYCVRPGKSGVTDGTSVIKESIRQKCIYNYAYELKKKRDLFWEYIERYYDYCVHERKIDDECSEKSLKKVGIPTKDIQKCFEESFYEYKDEKDFMYYSKNLFLDKDYELRTKNFISKSTSITINDRVYLGSWGAEYVFESLCASLIKKPESCYMEVTFDRSLKWVSLPVFIIIIVSVLIINIIIFLICKRIIKKGIQAKVDSTDIDNKIDTVVGSYLALRDSAPAEE